MKIIRQTLIIIAILSLGFIANAQPYDYNIVIAKDNLAKTINGTWSTDSINSKDYTGEISILSIDFVSATKNSDEFVKIVNDYLNNYNSDFEFEQKIEIINAGQGEVLFLKKMYQEIYPRKLRYCFVKQNEKITIFIGTDLEDRNEEFFIPFEVVDLQINTNSFKIRHEEMGEYVLLKK